jgi:hypothetical protein
MRGMEDACALTMALLVERMPAKIDELVARLAIDPAVLDAPKHYGPPTAQTPGEFPAVIVDGRDEGHPVRVEVNGDDQPATTYQVRYTLRVYLWIRGEEHDDVATRVRRMALAAREVLLGNQTFLGDRAAFLDETSMHGSFSDVTALDKARSLAAAFLEFDLTLEEVLTDPTIATADTVTVQEALLHPGLA